MAIARITGADITEFAEAIDLSEILEPGIGIELATSSLQNIPANEASRSSTRSAQTVPMT